MSHFLLFCCRRDNKSERRSTS